MSNRKHILLAIALLIVLGALGAIMRSQIPPRIDLPFDLQSTTLAAEFAHLPQDVSAVFGSGHGYGPAIVRQQYWDFAFIPCYVGLFIILALALRSYDVPAPRTLAWTGVACSVVAGALDVAENIAIIAVANNANVITSGVRRFSMPKWGLVFAASIVVSAVFLFWPRLRLPWRIAAAAVGALFALAGAGGLLFTLLGSIHDIAGSAEWLTWALTAALVFLSAVAVLQRPRK